MDGNDWYAYCGNNPINYFDPNGCAKVSHTAMMHSAFDRWINSNPEMRFGMKDGIMFTEEFQMRLLYEAVYNHVDLANLSIEQLDLIYMDEFGYVYPKYLRYSTAAAMLAITPGEVSSPSSIRNISPRNVFIKTFKSGILYETSFISSKGITIDAIAEVEISGSTLTLKNLTIYARGIEVKNIVGAKDFLIWQNQVIRLAKAQGFTKLIITAERVAKSTSANPGKIVTYIIDLTRSIPVINKTEL